MLMMSATIISAKCDMRMLQYIDNGTNLCARINVAISLPMFRQLQLTAPVFRGYLKRNMNIEGTASNNMATSYIRFPTFDPDDGHPYVWYAENGRPAITGKFKPKMRYYIDGSQIGAGTHGQNTGNMIFTSHVGEAEGSHFIGLTMTMYKSIAPELAMNEVGEWLAL